jgi:hypothetical protein
MFKVKKPYNPYKEDKHERKIRPIFDKYKDKDNWKKPFDVVVPTKEEAYKLKEGARYYQGSEAKVEKINVPIRHKEGLVYMQGTAYRVKSKGYGAY